MTLVAKSAKQAKNTMPAAARLIAKVCQSMLQNGATVKKDNSRKSVILFGIVILKRSFRAAKARQKRQYQENCSDYHDCLLPPAFQSSYFIEVLQWC